MSVDTLCGLECLTGVTDGVVSGLSQFCLGLLHGDIRTRQTQGCCLLGLLVHEEPGCPGPHGGVVGLLGRECGGLGAGAGGRLRAGTFAGAVLLVLALGEGFPGLVDGHVVADRIVGCVLYRRVEGPLRGVNACLGASQLRLRRRVGTHGTRRIQTGFVPQVLGNGQRLLRLLNSQLVSLVRLLSDSRRIGQGGTRGGNGGVTRRRRLRGLRQC